MKALVAQDDTILGFPVLGVEDGEMMSGAQIAILGRLPHTALREMPFLHTHLY